MIYPVIFFKYSNIIPDTTELAVFENASPRVRCEAGSKGLDSTSSLAKAFSTIFWEMVTLIRFYKGHDQCIVPEAVGDLRLYGTFC